VQDFGTYTKDSCDYPDVIYPAARALGIKKVDRAILICYTGIGTSIVANKVKGVRAALVYSIKSVKLSRKHNNSNALVLPAHLFKINYMKKLVSVWLNTEFEGGRHQKRIDMI